MTWESSITYQKNQTATRGRKPYEIKKIVVNSIKCFHKALECLNSRLIDTTTLDPNENIVQFLSIKLKQIHVLGPGTVAIQTKRSKTSKARPERKRSKLATLKFATKQFIKIL